MNPQNVNNNLPVIPDKLLPAASTTIIDADPEEIPVPLAHYLWILRRHFWKISGFVCGCVAVALIVSFL